MDAWARGRPGTDAGRSGGLEPGAGADEAGEEEMREEPVGWVSPNPGLLAPAQCLLLGVILARQYLDMKNYSIAMLYAHR